MNIATNAIGGGREVRSPPGSSTVGTNAPGTASAYHDKLCAVFGGRRLLEQPVVQSTMAIGENGQGPYCVYFPDPDGNKFPIYSL